MKKLWVLLRMQLWSNPALWLPPLLVVLFLGGSHLLARLFGPETAGGVNGPEAAAAVDLGWARAVSALAAIASVELSLLFYLVHYVSGMREDRSLLFWKSLPVSDSLLLAAALLFALLCFPLVALASAVLADLMALGFAGPTEAAPWSRFSAGFWGALAVIAIEDVLWLFPVMGWMLMVSAWVPRYTALVGFVLPGFLILVAGAFPGSLPLDFWLAERMPVMGRFLDALPEPLQQWPALGEDLRAQLEALWRSIQMQTDRGVVTAFLGRLELWAGLAVGGFFFWMAVLGLRWKGEKL